MIISAETKKIWDDVQANHKKLKECQRPHEFVPEDQKKLFTKYVCKKCGGLVDGVNARYYNDGLRDGRKTP